MSVHASVLTLVAGALVGAGLLHVFTGALRRWRLRRRFARSLRLEAEAEAFLLRKGFQVTSRQVVLPATVLVDNTSRPYEVRPDYLVRDLRGRRWVAEVKCGEEAPDPIYRDTRRQLLEYAVVVPDAAGVLLVDMERRALHEVAFPPLISHRVARALAERGLA